MLRESQSLEISQQHLVILDLLLKLAEEAECKVIKHAVLRYETVSFS